MDLTCMPQAKIGMMITLYFVGILVSLPSSTLPDKYGRKKSVLYSGLLSMLGQTLIIFNPNYNMRCLGYFILGLATLKNSQCYVWLSECFPLKDRASAFTVINMIDALPMFITNSFFFFFLRDWFPINIAILSLSYFALFLAIFLPESPRWLLVTN